MAGRNLSIPADIIKESTCCVALTGAGISTESGIPDFRGDHGIWRTYDINQYGHIASFKTNPEKVWKLLAAMDDQIRKAQPNPAHYALAELEHMGMLQAVITQNVDGLHGRAGSTTVLELHGTMSTMTCMSCGKHCCDSDVSLQILPPTCECGGVLKPDVTLFGENLPQQALVDAIKYARICDVMLVIGTSCDVIPAAELPGIARHYGTYIVEINKEKTPLTPFADHVIIGMASSSLHELVACIKKTE